MAQKSKYCIQAEESMKALGLYKSQFGPMIAVYAQLMTQYEALTKEFRASKYEYQIETKQGFKKAPIVTTLEALRKDILTYANTLGLTPQGLLKANEKAFDVKAVSGLEKALQAIDASEKEPHASD